MKLEKILDFMEKHDGILIGYVIGTAIFMVLRGFLAGFVLLGVSLLLAVLDLRRG